MSIAIPAKELEQIDQVNKRLYAKSLAYKLSTQSNQLGLQELYKPLLAQSEKQTTEITSASNRNTDKIVDSITAILDSLTAQNVLSERSADRIINQIKESDRQTLMILDDIFKQVSKKPV